EAGVEDLPGAARPARVRAPAGLLHEERPRRPEDAVQGVPALPEQVAILSRRRQNMIRFAAIRHGGACVSALALAAVLATGCSLSSVRRDLDLAESHPGPASAGDLMSAHDREALAGVSTARMQAGGRRRRPRRRPLLH